MFIEEIGEIGLIEEIKKLLHNGDKNIIVPIGDDSAVVELGKTKYILFTSDMLVENVHFDLTNYTPYQIGYKLLAVNISDIAAMAGIPKYALVSIAAKKKTEVEFIKELYRGILEVSKKNGVLIIGGDTTLSKENLVLDLSLIGEIEPEMVLTRKGAKVGDRILITGNLGASSLGLEIIRNPELKKLRSSEFFINAHFYPKPRIREARLAAYNGATAMEDISDGLSTDLHHICYNSGVGAEIYEQKMPFEKDMKKICENTEKSVLDFALNGGEDYELVFTCPEDKAISIAAIIEYSTGTPVSEIGQILPGREVYLIMKNGKKSVLKSGGYNHFLAGEEK